VVLTVLAIAALFPTVATPLFLVFWHWFDFWRQHRAATLSMVVGLVGGWTAALIVLHEPVLAPSIAMPWPARALGWALALASFVLSIVADRQLGVRVRAGMPFFEQGATIRLRTGGAYAVVRHPIYAAGIYYQVAMFLVSGALAIAVACLVLTLGALWFTRQEERRLVLLLEDPTEYDRYRARVGALVPQIRCRSCGFRRALR
jgi:protein-S-isoprenylcysteine O-methyltransferase Ste14